MFFDDIVMKLEISFVHWVYFCDFYLFFVIFK